ALTSGGIAELAETSVVRHAGWMVAVDAERRGTGATLVRVASGIEPEWLIDLFADQVKEETWVTWNAARERAETVSRMTYDVLKARLGRAACARVDALAPEKITLAAGRAARVEYEEGKPPWAESYLQDFFGMTKTPKIADGRASLVLHLWAPNKRAVQVTSD